MIVYIFILDQVTVTFIQDHRSVRQQKVLYQLFHNILERKNLCTNYLTMFSIDLDGILLSEETHTHFFSFSINIQGRESCVTWFRILITSHWLVSDMFQLVSFKLGMIIGTTKCYILISVSLALTSFKVTNVWEIFSQISGSIWAFVFFSFISWKLQSPRWR